MLKNKSKKRIEEQKKETTVQVHDDSSYKPR